MTTPNGGGPAFPIQNTSPAYAGMTLRDFFAAMAMQPIIAAELEGKVDGNEDRLAAYAYGYADAMIRAREEQP